MSAIISRSTGGQKTDSGFQLRQYKFAEAEIGLKLDFVIDDRNQPIDG